MRYLTVCVLALLILLPGSMSASPEGKPAIPVEELRALDKAISRAPRFDALKQARIDSLKRRLYSLPPTAIDSLWHATLLVSNAYRSTNADSALLYARRSETYAGADPERGVRSRLALVDALGMSGLFVSAVSTLDSVEKTPLDREMKVEMWKSSRRLYSYMMCYVSAKSPVYPQYLARYMAADDSLLNSLPRTDSFYHFLRCERMVSDGKYKEAKMMLANLLDGLPPSSNLYGMAAFQMAEVYRNQGDETLYASFLAKAAVSDIESAVTEGMALPALADWLYRQGMLDEAFDYVNFALEHANSGNARMRAVEIAALVPIIDQAYRKQINDSRDLLKMWSFLATFLLIMTAVLLFYLARRIRRSRADQKKLESVSKVQESYIGSFVSLCSSYADRLDSLSKLVAVKISAGQTEELLKLVKSGKFGEGKDEDFYRRFDEAFLDLYPDFVMKVNALLREEEQIFMRKGEGLSPELRIYAFVKLGVEESTRIAQILHYSVSTIYAYRNKMRNKAISRDTFDADVAAIGRS